MHKLKKPFCIFVFLGNEGLSCKVPSSEDYAWDCFSLYYRAASYPVYVMRCVILNSTAASCLWCSFLLFFFFFWREKEKVTANPLGNASTFCRRLISWLNIIGVKGTGGSLSLLLSHSDWSIRSTLRSTAAGHSSFFSGSLVSRERSKSHFPLSQTVHFFSKRDFWASENDILVLKV